MAIHIRNATDADKDFLITSIIEAEKSGSDIISYCSIFSISENELEELLRNILDENIEGQELCVSNFLIAEVDGEKAAALSTWIEKEDGMSSSFIKSNLLMHFLDREKMMAASGALSLIKETNIEREDKALQIECVYTGPGYRGLGLIKLLIDEHIKVRQDKGRTFHKAQIILLKNNLSALRAYEKAGFAVVKEKNCTDPSIFKLLSCDTKILMEKNIIL